MVNLAAQAGVRYSITNPDTYIQSNLIGFYNILDPSLQMRGQSPMNCPDSDVKEWGQNISHCLMTNEASALFHFLDVVNECKGNNKIWIYNEAPTVARPPQM